MKKYWIEKCVVSPAGELLPRGFVLTVDGEAATIEVLSDIPGDPRNLYEETIALSKETFSAHYNDSENTPVHAEDGELIGQPAEDYFSQFAGVRSDIQDYIDAL